MVPKRSWRSSKLFVTKSMIGFSPAFWAFLVLIYNCKVWALDGCRHVKRPTVKPFSTEELEVSWEGVFQNCNDSHTVTVTEGELHFQELSKEVLSQQKAVVKGDPCREYAIYLKVNKTIALPNNYNHIMEPDQVFGGFLKQELSKFCPTQSQPLKIPPALKDCVTNHSWTEQNPSFISVVILHPKYISDPKREIHLNITLEDCPSHKGFSKEQIICTVFVAVAAVLVLVMGITASYKKCATKDKNTTATVENSEMNDMYGQYEFDDADGTVFRLGSVWVKDKSPQYGEMEQENMCRQLSQVQVKDNNPEYDSVGS